MHSSTYIADFATPDTPLHTVPALTQLRRHPNSPNSRASFAHALTAPPNSSFVQAAKRIGTDSLPRLQHERYQLPDPWYYYNLIAVEFL